jgi:hypothetical protein
MNVVVSDEMSYLDLVQLQDYGLGNNNIAFEEYEKAFEIEVCGEGYHSTSLAYRKFYNECTRDEQTRRKAAGEVTNIISAGNSFREAFAAAGEIDNECKSKAKKDFPFFTNKRESCELLKKRVRNDQNY